MKYWLLLILRSLHETGMDILLIAFAMCGLMFYLGCAKPHTHEEWATRCLGIHDESRMIKCIEEWDKWNREVNR